MSCTRILVAVKWLLVLSVTDWASPGMLRGGFVQWNVRRCWLEVLQLSFSHFLKLQPCRFVSRHSLIQTKTAVPRVSAEGMVNLIHRWLQRLVPLQRIAVCLPYFFLPSKKSTAGSSVPLNSTCSKYRTWSLQRTWTLLSDEGRPADLQRGDPSQHAL